jgi:hypothetical protein
MPVTAVLLPRRSSRPTARYIDVCLLGRAVIAAGPSGSGVITMPFDPDEAWGAEADRPVGGTIDGWRIRSRRESKSGRDRDGRSARREHW